MAAGSIALPEGFTLDAPAAPAGLPPGFKLDAPPAAEPILMDKVKAVGRAVQMTQPGYWAAKGAEEVGHAVDKAAYDAGGKVTDLTGSPAAGYATNVGVQAIPVLLGAGSAKTVASPAIQTAARDVMQSALKPGIEALRSGKAAKAIDTLLEEGINVSRGGVEKLKSKIGELNTEIENALANSSATVSNSAVANRLRDTFNKFKNQVTPEADLEAVRKAWAEFSTAHPQSIPVQDAQKLKQGTYRALDEKSFGELKGADIESQKALARGLKEEIASAVPEVGPANASESKLLNALSLTERRVLMDANKNPGGLAWLTHNPAQFAAFMADRSPVFKSLVARMLNANAETIPTAAGGTIGALLGGSTAQAPKQTTLDALTR